MLGLGTILFTAWRVRQLRKIPLKKCLDFWQKKERIKKGKKEGRKKTNKQGRKEGREKGTRGIEWCVNKITISFMNYK